MGRHAPRTRERAKGAGAARRRRLPPRALGHVQPCDARLGPARGDLAEVEPESGCATRDASPRRGGRAGARGRRRAVVARRRQDRARTPARRAGGNYLAQGHALADGLTLLSPFQQGIERWTQRLPLVRQTVLDFRRHLMMNHPPHNRVVLQLAKLLDQHLLRDRRYRPLQVGEAQHLSAEQVKQDYELPSAFQKLERLLDTASGGDRRVSATLTFR